MDYINTAWQTRLIKKTGFSVQQPCVKLEAIFNSSVTNDSSIFVTELVLGHALISSIEEKKEENKELTSVSLYLIRI